MGVPPPDRKAGVALVGIDHRFVWVDDVLAQMLGYTPAELVGLRFEQITHPDDAQLGSQFVDRFIAGELASLDYDKRYIAKDGTIVPIHVSATWIRDAQGKALYGVAVVTPIGERIPPVDLRVAEPPVIDELERIRRAILD
jgi:PAS domain S-box-containing protein